MEREQRTITLDTLPNGYSLEVDGEAFMYFNEADLLAGFLTHVGLAESKSMERGTILSGLVAALFGQAYAEGVATLRARVNQLTLRANDAMSEMDEATNYAHTAGKTITDLKAQVQELRESVQALCTEHYDARKATKELSEDVTRQKQRIDGVLAKISKAEAALPADKPDEEQPEDGKRKRRSKKDAVPEDGRRKRRSRKEADEAILRGLEEQAKNNPNIK